VQVFVPGTRQPLDDGLELKQQIVAERAHQAEVRILFFAELLDQRPQNGEYRRLPAALLFGNSVGMGFNRPASMPDSKPNSSQWGWPASTGWNISRILRPRSLSGRNSTRRS